MQPQAPGGQWVSQTAISWSHIFGYGPYPPECGLGSRTKKRSIMRSFLAFGACTTIPNWAMLWVKYLLGAFLDGPGRFCGYADPQGGGPHIHVTMCNKPATGVNMCAHVLIIINRSRQEKKKSSKKRGELEANEAKVTPQ